MVESNIMYRWYAKKSEADDIKEYTLAELTKDDGDSYTLG